MQRVKDLLANAKPITWLFYGDSITHAVTHTFGQRDYTQLFHERIRAEMGRGMDVVINTAISGNTTRNLLESFDHRVSRFSPDVVFLMIGMNDCVTNNGLSLEEFTANLHSLCDKFESLGSVAVLQTTCRILPNSSPFHEPDYPKYMQAIRDVAAQRGLPLVDHTAYWEDNAEKLYYWMSNAFHPNEYGHRAFAELLFTEMDIWDPNSPTCRLMVP
jgi:lysophospholipase L1-like esterase